jgi:hypothetical protein
MLSTVVVENLLDFIFFLAINNIWRWTEAVINDIWVQLFIDNHRLKKGNVEHRVDFP